MSRNFALLRKNSCTRHQEAYIDTPAKLHFFNRTPNARQPAMVRVAARTNKPPRYEPVARRITPIMEEPKPPPRLPMLLMTAMPTAAVDVPSNVVGIAQKGPTIDCTPMAATEIVMTSTAVEPE